jgi:hypothetical protein
MKEECIHIRLDKIYKKLSTIQTALFSVVNDLEHCIEEDNKDIDGIIYSSETLEGITGIIDDIQNDINLLAEDLTDEPPEEILNKNLN